MTSLNPAWAREKWAKDRVAGSLYGYTLTASRTRIGAIGAEINLSKTRIRMYSLCKIHFRSISSLYGEKRYLNLDQQLLYTAKPWRFAFSSGARFSLESCKLQDSCSEIKPLKHIYSRTRWKSSCQLKHNVCAKRYGPVSSKLACTFLWGSECVGEDMLVLQNKALGCLSEIFFTAC